MEPFGDEWRRSALTTAAIYNVNRTDGSGFEADDFMPLPKRDEPEADQTLEEIAAIFAACGVPVQYGNDL